jgi:hypothetical protein
MVRISIIGRDRNSRLVTRRCPLDAIRFLENGTTIVACLGIVGTERNRPPELLACIGILLRPVQDVPETVMGFRGFRVLLQRLANQSGGLFQPSLLHP